MIKDLSFDEDECLLKIGVSLVDTTHPSEDSYVEMELVNAGRAVEPAF